MSTREEHIEFCKKRALAYLDEGDVTNAVTSMLSDLKGRADTHEVATITTLLGMHAIMSGEDEARRFIEGFR